MTRRRAVVVGIAVVVAVVGTAVALLGGRGRVVTAGDVRVLVSERTSAGMDALLGGRLGVLGGCLGVSGAVVVWPHGTEVLDDDPLTIRVPGAGGVGLGDEVQVGGGFVSEPSPSSGPAVGPLEVAGVSVPADCAAYPVFLAH